MSERCSAIQVAEAICIVSIGSIPIKVIEIEDIENFKCLELILSTITVFADAFYIEMRESYEEFLEQLHISKKSFIDFLKPRALLLAEKNECFDFVLVCTYFSEIIDYRSCHSCFHLARVAHKLLTKVLEDRFSESFETEGGWENLILYCRNIHAAVYPSEKNRPPGYVPYLKKFEYYFSSCKEIENNKVGESTEEIVDTNIAEINNDIKDEKMTESNEEINKCNIPETTKDIIYDKMAESEKEIDNNKISNIIKEFEDEEIRDSIKENVETENIEKKRFENTTKSDEIFRAELFGLKPFDSTNVDDYSTDTESITNNTIYWKYLSLDHDIFCATITHNEAHLKDVYDLLEEMKIGMDTNCIPLDELNISFSDDEYLEHLEKEEKPKSRFSDNMKELCAKQICDEQNKKTGATSIQNKVNPEDITEDQILEFIQKEYKDDPKCEVCDGKMRAFMKKWEENFREKYNNWSTVTDCIQFSHWQ